jgi:putative nucleotidyltransferase with HDIG domain
MPTPAPQLPPLLDRLRPLLADSDAYLVGGAVRDLLLSRPVHDLDFALAGDAVWLARRVADRLGLPFYILDAERGMGRIVVTEGDTQTTLDFARFRGSDLTADLMGRDFTINALALPATATDASALVDPLGGRDDLAQRQLRATTATALHDDPVRVIRAVRFAAQLGFTIEPQTWDLMRAAASELDRPSAERLRDELSHVLAGPHPSHALRQLDDLGALAALFPEIAALKGVAQPPPHWQDGWQHTLSAIERLEAVLAALDLQPPNDAKTVGAQFISAASPSSDADLRALHPALHAYRPYLAEHLAVKLTDERARRALLFLAALLHDIGKPVTRAVDETGRIQFPDHAEVGARLAQPRLRALRFSADEVAWVARIVAGHMRPGELAASPLGRRDVYRYFRALGEAGVDTGLLALADHLAAWGRDLRHERWQQRIQAVATLLDHYFRRYTRTIAPPPLLNGDDLMRNLKLAPGPIVGQLLEAIREAQAAGEIRSRAAALALARQILNS